MHEPSFWDTMGESTEDEIQKPPVPHTAVFYLDAYRQLLGKVPCPPPFIHITYYACWTVQAKILFREGTLYIKMSHLLRDMPEEIHRHLALVLVSKLEKRPCPKGNREKFLQYARSDFILQKQMERRARQRNTIRVYGTKGHRYDLEQVFERVNRKYFKNSLSKPVLSWTKGNNIRRIGYAKVQANSVYISRALDDDQVPQYVIDFVLYHELLHLVHDSRKQGSRNLYHTPEFRKDERQFPQYEKAQKWISRNIASSARKRKRFFGL